MTRFFIHRPIFACSIALLMLLAGGVSILALPIAQYPDIVPGTVQVSASYPGASAEVTERVITNPLEQQINGVEGMIYMSSNSTSNGTSSITVSFEVGYDLNIGSVDIQNRVQTAEAQLPEETQKAGISVTKNSPDITLIVSLFSPNDSYDNTYLGNYAQINIVNPLLRVPGVGSVTIFGLKNYSIRIWLDPEKMASLGITTQEVSDAVSNQNVDIAAGNIGQPPVSGQPALLYQVTTLGQLREPDQFNEIVVRTGSDGSVVRIKDIGYAELGAEDYTTTTFLNKKPTATMAIFQLPGANALQVSEGVRALMEKSKQNFPDDLDFQVSYDTTDFVRVSLDELVMTLLEAILLVVMVVFIFLQSWRTTLIPVIAIPVSLIATFVALAAFGFSINTLTLLGLVLAVGLVVDDAIVVVENVERQFEEGETDSKKAAEKAMSEVTAPIVATTLVLMSVFIPTAFMPGIAGRLYNQFALTIAFSVAISAINSLTLSPALSGVLLRKPKEGKKFILYRWFNTGFTKFTNGYERIIRFFARAWVAVLIVFCVLIGWTWFELKHTPTGFVPAEDQGWFFTLVELPAGASVARTTTAVNELADLLLANEAVENVVTVNGLDFLEMVAVSNYGLAFVMLKPWDERTTTETQIPGILDVVREQAASIEGAVIFPINAPPIPGLGSTGGFQFQLEDINSKGLEALQEVTTEFLAKANARPEIKGVMTDFAINYPQLYLEIDRAQAEILGVSVGSLFNTLQTYLSSLYINNYNKYGQVYQVRLMAENDARMEPEDIGRLRVQSDSGSSIPFSELMTLEYTMGPVNLPRYNLYDSPQIIGGPADGYSGGQAVKAMDEVAQEVLPPAGFGYEWTGTVYQQLIAGQYAPIIFILGLAFVFLVLSSLYESWTMPFMVLLAVPLAVLGAMLALSIRSLPLDVYGQIGLLMLVGLAAKNAILIVEFARNLREQGMEIVEAAMTASRMRLRPILMTALAFILGVMPLVFASGAGAASRHSIGTTVFGGMLASTILSLLIVPIFYIVIEWMREKVMGGKASPESDPAE